MLQLQIENTNICNARCIFCCYDKMTRPKGVMSNELFRKIVDDAASIPQFEKATITGLGEPLIDKSILDKCRYLRAKMNLRVLDLYTNGTLLTADLIREFAKVPLSTLYVSLNAVDAERRESLMGLNDYDRVAGILDNALSANLNGMRILVKSVAGKDLFEPWEAEVFIKRWGGMHDNGGHVFMHLEGNWAGAMYPLRVIPRSGCMRALEQFMVLWDGRVALCCFDGDGEVILGDLRHQSIKDIYNSGLALEYRQAHYDGKRAQLKLCGNCTTI